MHFIVKLRSANFLLNEYCIILYCIVLQRWWSFCSATNRAESNVLSVRVARGHQAHHATINRVRTARSLPLHRHSDQAGGFPRRHQQPPQQVRELPARKPLSAGKINPFMHKVAKMVT